jgi:hypothetical protein
MRAVQKQRYETVRYLLEKGADTGKKVRVGRYAEAAEGTVYVIAAEINDPVMNKILGIAGSAQDIIPADYDKK